MNSKSYSGKDLEKALTEGALTQAQATLIGMVKPSEKSGHVSFSQAGCDKWVDLPTDMIERADQEGQRTCRDHSHPVMKITFKEPKNSTGKVLLELLSQSEVSPPMESSGASARLPRRIYESQLSELLGALRFEGRSQRDIPGVVYFDDSPQRPSPTGGWRCAPGASYECGSLLGGGTMICCDHWIPDTTIGPAPSHATRR